MIEKTGDFKEGESKSDIDPSKPEVIKKGSYSANNQDELTELEERINKLTNGLTQ